MEVRYLPDRRSFKKLNTDEIRNAFLVDGLFQDGCIKTVYVDLDRAIVGGAVPSNERLSLLASRKELSSDYFTERREIGIFNVGGQGTVEADEKGFKVAFKDAVYLGKGTRRISFSSDDPANPGHFFFVSFPAHSAHPAMLMKFGEANSSRLGAMQSANMRTVRKYIHNDGVKSSQLVMGLTDLDEGSVWNTMPPHTHQRRTEIYFYFGLGNGEVVFHMMGEPSDTRHLVVSDKQAVVSPSWSIHSGTGTKNYSFIWAMGGENQDFDDVEAVGVEDLK